MNGTPPPPPPMHGIRHARAPPHGGARAPPPPPSPPPPSGPLGGPGGRARAVKKSNLKPLHWNKVTRALKGSLWEELQRQCPPDVDVSELENLFSNTPLKEAAYIRGAPSGPGKMCGCQGCFWEGLHRQTPPELDVSERKTMFSNVVKPAPRQPHKEKIQLIDQGRATNTENMLTKVKMPPAYIAEAVLAMDDSLLDVDQVENILKFYPTKEEIDQLKNYKGDIEQLGKCEHFFLELMKVPRMEAKLNTFMFKLQFNSQLANFRNCLNIVHSACDEVRKSVKFKEFIKRILYLGSTLNQGTSRVGFKLDSLLKLSETRASNSNMTLMHYLCKFVAAKSPALLDFPEDLVSLEAATKIHLRALAEEMLAFRSGLKKVKNELEACANDGPVSEGFRKTLKEFISHAEAEVTSATNFYTVVGQSADRLALYFGEDPSRCPFEQATQTLSSFVRLFRKCHEDNLKQAEPERKMAEKEACQNPANNCSESIVIVHKNITNV
ncbi:putative formin, FH2 domain-containing protein [Helianthus annuus]|nr:putative formin, FH2 domain-containing protein [Helianthus annuus]